MFTLSLIIFRTPDKNKNTQRTPFQKDKSKIKNPIIRLRRDRCVTFPVRNGESGNFCLKTYKRYSGGYVG